MPENMVNAACCVLARVLIVTQVSVKHKLQPKFNLASFLEFECGDQSLLLSYSSQARKDNGAVRSSQVSFWEGNGWHVSID